MQLLRLAVAVLAKVAGAMCHLAHSRSLPLFSFHTSRTGSRTKDIS